MENTTAQILALLRERLDSNDQKRASVQQSIASKIAFIEDEINGMRENLLLALEKTLGDEQERLWKAVTELAALQSAPTTNSALAGPSIANARKELHSLKTPAITKLPNGNFRELLSINFTPSTEDTESDFDEENIELAIQTLIEKLKRVIEKKDADRASAQEEVNSCSDGFLSELRDLKEQLNADLEPEYRREDERLQKLVSDISKRVRRTGPDKEDGAYLAGIIRMGRAGLVVEKKYSIIKNPCSQFLRDFYKLAVTETIPKLGEMAPENVRVKDVKCGEVLVDFDELFDPDEQSVLKSFGINGDIKLIVGMREKRGEKPKSSEWELNKTTRLFTPFYLKEETEYVLNMWVEYEGVRSSASRPVTFKTPSFSECCAWKECKSVCDDGDNEEERYILLDGNRTAIMNDCGKELAICGNTFIPLNKVASWNIKVLNSVDNSNESIFIGVTCFDFEELVETQPENCKWWCINWENSLLYSGPPHNYGGVKYCLSKKNEEDNDDYFDYDYEEDDEEDNDDYEDYDDNEFICNKNIVGVIMDTTKGNLSFVLNGVNHGIAYEGIPLDKPLIPYVLLINRGDSVELDLSEVSENVSCSVFAPSNIVARSVTWESVTVTWDPIEDIPFYQIEVDGLIQKPIAETEYTRRGLLPETEHNFRVRAVNRNSVSRWSVSVKARTVKAPGFSGCARKECPDGTS